MAYHAGAAAVCLLGGDYAGLNPQDPCERAWLWNGQQWTAPPTREAPPAVSLVAAAGDPERKSVLIFGGFTVSGRGSTGRRLAICGSSTRTCGGASGYPTACAPRPAIITPWRLMPAADDW